MSTHPPDPWAHDPNLCPSLECPGCWADSYVPHPRQTLAEHLDEVYCSVQPCDCHRYDNGDRAEDTERGIANGSGSSFYVDGE